MADLRPEAHELNIKSTNTFNFKQMNRARVKQRMVNEEAHNSSVFGKNRQNQTGTPE